MRFIRLKELLGFFVPVSKSTLYGWIKRRDFPPPVKFGKTSAWALSDVEEWQKNKREQVRVA